MALARAVPGSELFLIDGFSHITPEAVGWAGQLQLVSAIQAVLERRATATPSSRSGSGGIAGGDPPSLCNCSTLLKAIGTASWRERVCQYVENTVVAVALK